MPPLPGEPDDADLEQAVSKTQERVGRLADEPDETDYDTPGTVTKPQLTKLGATFTDLGFTHAERDQRLVAASQIVGRDMETSSDLSRNEAKVLIDTLERCDGSREKLIALLANGERPGATDAS